MGDFPLFIGGFEGCGGNGGKDFLGLFWVKMAGKVCQMFPHFLEDVKNGETFKQILTE